MLAARDTPGPAPYHADVAAGPPHGQACWVRTADGIRIRVGIWRDGSRGTLFLVPGRTEYIEKYSDAALQMARRGYACAVVDVRGQGLSPRAARHRHIGHVNDFSEFQADVDAMLELAAELDLPRPWHVMGHSMGGAIVLRTLMRRPSVFERAIFSAPMWGLELTPHRRFMGWTVSALASSLGFGEQGAPGSGKVADPAGALFEDNLLTRDPEMFAWMKRQITTHPDLALGGPSIGWVWAALREMHTCARAPAPDVPALTFLGTDEKIVSSDAIHVRMASWDNGTQEIVEGARHEVLMEGADLRRRLYDRIAGHLDG